VNTCPSSPATLERSGSAHLAAAGQALYTVASSGETAVVDPDLARDSEDVTATLAGDKDAFGRIIARRQSELARVLWRFTRDAGVLEELVQDAFVEAFTSLRRFDTRRPLGPWLRKIAARVGYRHWKALARARGRVPLDAVGELPAPDKGVSPATAAEEVHTLLARLAPRDRLVLTLVYLEGCSVAEAAELTGWSRTMVKVQAHRARARLRRLLGQGASGRTGQ